MVKVLDASGEPISGASVTFVLPSAGASGTFGESGLSLTVQTDLSGTAVGRGLRPNGVAGQFRIRVSTSWRSVPAVAMLAQTNAEPVAKSDTVRRSPFWQWWRERWRGAWQWRRAAASRILRIRRLRGRLPLDRSAPGRQRWARRIRPQIRTGGADPKFMFSRRFAGLSMLVLLVGSAPAYDLFGPVLGLLPDVRIGTVRPIRGIPGAASIGDLVDTGTDATSIAMTPRHSSALLITDAGARVASLEADGTWTTAQLELPSDFHPTIVKFSATGQTAALYDPSARQLWLSAGATRQIDPSQLPAQIDLLAVSDGADFPIAGTSRDDSHSVFVLDAKGGLSRIPGFTKVTDVTFLGSGGDLAVADGGAKQVLLVRKPLSSSSPDLLLEVAGAPEGAVRIASSGDGQMLAVLAAQKADRRTVARPAAAGGRHPAETGNPVLGLLRLADRQWNPVECDCAPVNLTALKGNSVYRLTDRVDQPLWILDGDSGAARVMFVPAVQK